MKKLLSTIMALVMLLSLVPMAVAEEGASATRWSTEKSDKHVAQVGDMYYETLADAVAAVPVHGDTVTLLRDANGDGITVQSGKNFTLDFGGHSYTVDGKPTGSPGTESQAFQLLEGSTIVFKNGKIVGNVVGVKLLIQNYCNLTLDNMTLDATVGNNSVSYSMSNNCGIVTIKNTTITAKANGVAFDVFGGFQSYGDVTVTVTGNSVINGKVEVARSGSYPDNSNKNTLVVESGTINGAIDNTSGTVVVKGGAFTDLASAVKYATNGATITLAGDATGDIVIPADKTITLDLGGKTLTNSETAIINNGTLTVDNGKIVSTSNVGIGVGDNSKTTIQPGVTIESQEGAVITSYATGATITINGGNFSAKDNAVIAGNGSKTAGKNGPERKSGNTITINGGTFTGNITSEGYIACGIYAPWKDIITVNDGTFIVNNGIGVVARAGQVYINGGTFTCNGAAKGKVGDKNFDMDAAQALYFDDSDPSYPAYNKDTDGIFVSGGKFSSDPTAFVTDTDLVVVPNVGKTEYTVQPKTSEDGNTTTTTEVSEDGKTKTETKTETTTDGSTVTKTETDLDTGKTTEDKTETKVETKNENGVTTETTTVTNTKTEDGKTTEATETVTTKKTEENGAETTVVTEKDTLTGTETTEVTAVTAPTTASDVTLDVSNTTSVEVNKASMSALKDDTVKDVIIETEQATLKLDKTAVKTMESKVEDNGSDKLTLKVKVTEEKNASTTEIEKIAVEVTATNNAGENVFPKDTEHTNGKINITIPYAGTATYLDLWYNANGNSTYMGRFPVDTVNHTVSFDVKHFSQYDLVPVVSSGSSVIKNGSTSSAASGTHTVTTDLTPGSITKVTVDGKVVDAKYYTVNGSNVTFTAEFLKTLKNGSHTVTVENATKIAKGVFTVNNPTTSQSPTTADAGIALYAGMAIASVMGTGVVFTSRKRKNH